MDEESVREKIAQAIQNLFEKQPDMFDLTPESAQTEWNLNYHLANQISELFPEYQFDIEVRKPHAGNRRPDIVFHQRGIHENNFLVVELKRNNEKAMQGDLEKIETYWFGEPYVYQFGAAVNLNADFSYQVEVRSNRKNPKNN